MAARTPASSPTEGYNRPQMRGQLMIETKIRPRNTDLRPLVVNQAQSFEHPRRNSISRQPFPGSSRSPWSAMSLASPSLVAQYYRDHDLWTVLQNKPWRYHNPPPSQNLSRRRSSVLSPGALANRLGGFAVSSPAGPASEVGINAQRRPRSLVDESRDMLLAGVDRSELARLGNVSSKSKSMVVQYYTVPSPIRVPDNYTLEHLREWGYAQLGNISTSDAFVRAVQLRPDRNPGEVDPIETGTVGEAGNSVKDNDNVVVVKARVLPRGAERKPFLMQRRFDLNELRQGVIRTGVPPSITQPDSDEERDTKSPSNAANMEQSHVKTRTRRSRSCSSPVLPRSSAGQIPSSNPGIESAGYSKRQVIPLHVAYALHYLPVLGAFMLSGHIRRGDTIDLPLPHPEAWLEVVSHIYTGNGRVTAAMRENILYLGGRAE